MNFKSFSERTNRYALTFLVWNNLLSLFIALAMHEKSTKSFFAHLACILVVSHVTALVCLLVIDALRPLLRKLIGSDDRKIYFSYIIPFSVAIMPGLMAGFYASKLFADFFNIDWHPDIWQIIKPGLVFGAITFLLNFLYFNWIYSVRAHYQKELDLKTLETHLLESNLKVLMSELNPHILFNTLNSVIELLRSNPVRAEHMLLALCDYYQSVLVVLDKKSVSLAQEIELCGKYIDMQKERYLNLGFNVSFADNYLREFQLPPLTLQPLIENSLKHGFSSMPHEQLKEIGLSIIRVANRIHIRIADNGAGIQYNAKVKSHSLGLRNCEERLKWLLGESCEIEVSSSPKGTTVILDLPYANTNQV